MLRCPAPAGGASAFLFLCHIVAVGRVRSCIGDERTEKSLTVTLHSTLFLLNLVCFIFIISSMRKRPPEQPEGGCSLATLFARARQRATPPVSDTDDAGRPPEALAPGGARGDGSAAAVVTFKRARPPSSTWCVQTDTTATFTFIF